MHSLDDETRKQVLGEVLMDELKVIREYLEDVPIIKQKVTKLETDVEELKSDMKIVKAAIVDHSRELNEHGVRLGALEVSH